MGDRMDVQQVGQSLEPKSGFDDALKEAIEPVVKVNGLFPNGKRLNRSPCTMN